MKNRILHSFKRWYKRPICMPIWNYILMYLIWILSIFGYVCAVKSIKFVIFGLVFQYIAMYIPLICDNGNWRETEDGKAYSKEYE